MCVYGVDMAGGKSSGENPFGSDLHQLSHDLRTPLNHINGFAELLLMDGSLSAAHADYVRAIMNGSQALQAAVVSYLDRSGDIPALAPARASAPAQMAMACRAVSRRYAA